MLRHYPQVMNGLQLRRLHFLQHYPGVMLLRGCKEVGYNCDSVFDQSRRCSEVYILLSQMRLSEQQVVPCIGQVSLRLNDNCIHQCPKPEANVFTLNLLIATLALLPQSYNPSPSSILLKGLPNARQLHSLKGGECASGLHQRRSTRYSPNIHTMLNR